MDRETLIKSLTEKWPSDIVPRTKFHEFSGGAFKPGTLANKDSKGVGPKGRMLIGKGVYYPASNAAAWVADQLRPVELPATADFG